MCPDLGRKVVVTRSGAIAEDRVIILVIENLDANQRGMNKMVISVKSS